ELHRSLVTVYVGPEEYPFYFHKGRLCEHSSYFEKAFHGSFKEAANGSILLEEDGIDEFKVFEEWLYSGKFSYPKDSGDPSLLLVKVFCFADKVGLPDLQNATLDAIRDRAAEQHVSPPTQNETYETYPQPRRLFGSAQQPIFGTPRDDTVITSPGLGKPVAKSLPPATVSAINYAYEKTLERSPLRKLLTDIFAYDVEPERLDRNILLFPMEFVADVLLTNMKRLPFRLNNEEADFDKNADRYHIHDSSSTPDDRNKNVRRCGGERDIFEWQREERDSIFLLSPPPLLALSALSFVKFLAGIYCAGAHIGYFVNCSERVDSQFSFTNTVGELSEI
ncbi:MAG: hypothetical protein Q9201_000458, partial [Fulgogasparrea decipioides]